MVVPPLHMVLQAIRTEVLVVCTEEHVSPLERPLLATAIPIAAVASVPAGGSGSPGFVPKSRIDPLESTAPDTTAAIAASTPLVFSGANCVRCATVFPGRQLLSTRPGCEIASPGFA